MQKSLHTEQQDRLLSLLRELRQNNNVTQADLAMRLDVTQSDISKVERGVRRLDVLELRAWLKALGTSLPEFALGLEAEIEAIAALNRRLQKKATPSNTRS
ncbi:MAG: XRE family transcriptional regulator [Aquabacterium sp.]|uniref:helix-turn-helix domain-containing protein n=1 Tax=Aquabacterium sp. TaxID=1872578 RepID=UPI001228F07E|nr:helix-turn-helix transcriptional regulator [Aquabacterium sp.]TAK97748.1 MAG: XRE family transcriptional regulator [Aquabacterium sp.]